MKGYLVALAIGILGCHSPEVKSVPDVQSECGEASSSDLRLKCGKVAESDLRAKCGEALDPKAHPEWVLNLHFHPKCGSAQDKSE